eukprot:GGOE01023836.1.p1 GENE.GGOE01023836.1~~GGOE01023836.1.p1  ORF type:complete len:813 (-),score=227.04 GGOE01023836.1:411-2795(-)
MSNECNGLNGDRQYLHKERVAIAEMLEIAKLEAVSQSQKARGNLGKMLQHLKEGTKLLEERRAEVAQAQKEFLQIKEEHVKAVVQLNLEREQLIVLQLAFVKEKEELAHELQKVQEKEKMLGGLDVMQLLHEQRELCKKLQNSKDLLEQDCIALRNIVWAQSSLEEMSKYDKAVEVEANCLRLQMERDELRCQLLRTQEIHTGSASPSQDVDPSGREDIDALVKVIEEELQALQAEREALLRDSDLAGDCARLETIVSSLQQEKEALEQELQTRPSDFKVWSAMWVQGEETSDLEKLEGVVERLQAEKEELEAKLCTALEECQASNLQLHNAVCGSDSTAMQEAGEQPVPLQKQLVRMQEEASRMQAERLKAERSLEELGMAMQAAEQTNAALQAEVASLEKEKSRLAKALQEAPGQADPPAASIMEQLREAVARLQVENTALEEKLFVALEECQELKRSGDAKATMAEQIRTTKKVNAALQAQVASLEREKAQLTTALEAATKFGESCQANCSQREQETKLLMTALAEANKRFETLGCRRIEPAGHGEESVSGRPHLGFVAGLRNGTKRVSSSESRRSLMEEILGDSSTFQHPLLQTPESLNSKTTGSLLLNEHRAGDTFFHEASPPHPTRPPDLFASPDSLLRPLHHANAPALELHLEEQFKDTYITLGYLVHIKLSFQAADTDQQGQLDMAKLGEWCLKVGYVDITFSHLKAMIDQVDLTKTQTVSFWSFFAIQSYMHLNLRGKGVALQHWLCFIMLPSLRPAIGPLLPPVVVSPIRPSDAEHLRSSLSWT